MRHAQHAFFPPGAAQRMTEAEMRRFRRLHGDAIGCAARAMPDHPLPFPALTADGYSYLTYARVPSGTVCRTWRGDLVTLP